MFFFIKCDYFLLRARRYDNVLATLIGALDKFIVVVCGCWDCILGRHRKFFSRVQRGEKYKSGRRLGHIKKFEAVLFSCVYFNM